MHDTNTLQRLFRYKAWANNEVLTTMKKFPDDSPAKAIAIRILNHTFIVDRIFAANLRCAEHGYSSPNDGAPTLEELSGAIGESDRWYIDYVSSLDPAYLAERLDFTFTDGKPGRMSREEMLMHVTIHGEYHRGQIGLLMLQNSITPTDDGFTTYLQKTEALSRRRG
ncbi:MAG TPA: DinB family protein [Candidatus Binataceae bacterium]|nr:DinB family protein [Candidatus Binataceae bacterium]